MAYAWYSAIKAAKRKAAPCGEAVIVSGSLVMQMMICNKNFVLLMFVATPFRKYYVIAEVCTLCLTYTWNVQGDTRIHSLLTPSCTSVKFTVEPDIPTCREFISVSNGISVKKNAKVELFYCIKTKDNPKIVIRLLVSWKNQFHLQILGVLGPVVHQKWGLGKFIKGTQYWWQIFF